MGKLQFQTFWKSVAERAIKTVAQVAIAFIGTGLVGVFDVDWGRLLSVSLMAGFVSVLTSLANLDERGQAKMVHGRS